MTRIQDTDFVEQSILEILIPQASDKDLEDILQTAEDTNAAGLVSSIPQRDLLFFGKNHQFKHTALYQLTGIDESVPVYAVLKTTHNDEKALKDCLSRINIGLEAHVVSLPNVHDSHKDKTSSSGQTRDVVWSGKVDVTEDPITVVVESADASKTVLLAWKTTVRLGRPRIRLQAPSVLFKISASLQPASPENGHELDPYLPSGVPLPSNILQPLGVDAALKNVLPRLAVSRQRPSPSVPKQQDSLPIKVVPRRACRAVPALSSRIRIQKAPFNTGTPSMIGNLEIDVPPFAQYPLQITDIRISLPQGQVHEISAGQTPQLSTILRARDQLVCLYNLQQDAQAIAQGQAVQILDILISVSILVSEECHPRVQVGFKANVDFSGNMASHNSNKNAASQRTHKADLSLSMLKPGDRLLDTSTEIQSSTVQEKLGIVIKLTAKGTIYVGETFRWEIFVINRSGKQRRLGLSMMHKRKSGNEKQISSRPPSLTTGRQVKSDLVAEAFTDDNLLYTMMKSHNRNATHLLCLNTDVKIGPLNPGSCYSTEMEFLPLTRGFLHVEAIRLTDYTTNEAVDLRELPDILAIERR